MNWLDLYEQLFLKFPFFVLLFVNGRRLVLRFSALPPQKCLQTFKSVILDLFRTGSKTYMHQC